MPTVFESLSAVEAAVGQKLGPSDWLEITQDRIDKFAEATGDRQWIHVDPELAKHGPFGATIAHGYLTLSLTSWFMPQIVSVHGIRMGVNYGTNKVRFPSPVRVGSRLRAVAEILSAERVNGGVQVTTRITLEIEGGEKPACVVESVSRYME